MKPHIHVEEARRFFLNQSSYERQLNHFIHLQKDVAERILTSFQNGDWSAAERESHSLKGNAATLGMLPLREISAELESLLKQQADAPSIEEAISSLAQELKEVIDVIERM